MTTTMPVTTSIVDSLIGSFRSLLLGHSLPTPVTVTFYPQTREVTVQPEGALDLARQLGNVLLWARTLTEVTAEWSHTEEDRLLVSVHGRTASGTRIQVYGGGPFVECLGLIQLDPGQHEGVSLDELYTLAGLLREAEPVREAA